MISQNPNNSPKASVILPVFNAEPYLEEAVRSVLDQTFTDFECLLLNDGSTDGSLVILEKFAHQDARFKIHSWPNQGLIRTLNRGIELSGGEIIFRMDGDDISASDRFEKQIEYLDAHPECVAVGSRILLTDESGLPIREFIDAFEHADIDAAHLSGIGGAVPHAASAIRRNALSKINGYRQGFAHAEDVDLFLRLAEVGKLANLPEALYYYRQHPASTCHVHTVEQSAAARKAVVDARVRRGIEPAILPYMEIKIEKDSLSALHRKWAWWALGASNLKTARKHAWRAFVTNPFELANLRLVACVLRGH